MDYPIILSGYEFKKKYHKYLDKLYKLTNQAEIHYGFVFKTGTNVDTQTISMDKCKPGGLHFCFAKDFLKWLNYYTICHNKHMIFYRKVKIPSDAIVYVYRDKIKADQIILEERKEIWTNYDLCLSLVKEYGMCLKYLDETFQTDEMCREALKSCPTAMLHAMISRATVTYYVYTESDDYSTAQTMKKLFKKIHKAKVPNISSSV